MTQSSNSGPSDDRRLPSGGGPSGKPGGGGTPPPSMFRMDGRRWLILLGVAVLFNVIWYYFVAQNTMQGQGAQIALKYGQLVPEIKANNIKTADITSTSISGTFVKPYVSEKKQYVRFTTPLLAGYAYPTQLLLDRHGAKLAGPVSTESPVWLTLLGYLFAALPFILLIGLFFFLSRAARQQSQGVFGFGQGRGKLYTEDRPSTTFADVAGVDAAKGELREVVDFLKEPAKYHSLGARIPKGVLLVGPPGTGKTLLARAVAGEANVPFLAISATEFVELFVGVGASRVRDLFNRARAVAPAILFVDEIDAIGGSRGGRGPMGGGANDEREQTLNQLLVSMDGFEPNEAVIVLGATNRPDVLDPALLRPGRFDRQVVVDPPDRKGREAILKIHTAKIPLAPDVDLSSLAAQTPGMSGADLANLANEAALAAARRGGTKVSQVDFNLALDRIMLGLEGSPLMLEDERRAVAYHEGGHALVAFMLPNVDPVARITITPRGRSLGVTQFQPIDERRNYRRDYLVNRMAVGMGGRAAEETVFDDITSGAQNDLQMVTNIARTMVTQLGMADDIGPTYLGGAGDDALGGRAYNPWEPKEYSDETASRIDIAVQRLVEQAHARAVQVLKDNRQTLDDLAAALLRDETLDREQFTAIVNAHRPPGEPPLPVPMGPGTPTGEQQEADAPMGVTAPRPD